MGQACVDSVRSAIRAGYRHIDTALLYNNQEAVGKAIQQAIAAGEVARKDLWVTSKVGFYPETANGANCWIPATTGFHNCNKKGARVTREAIALCLQKLGLHYVDLMLIHNPCTQIDDYQASGCPHQFELSKSNLTQDERNMVLTARLDKVKYCSASAEAARAETWRALEEAQQDGKCRYIGVSNYPPHLIQAMENYAKVMPAVNQLELHPRFSSPSLRQFAQQHGMVLTGYGSGNSVVIERSETIKGIADRLGKSPIAVVLRWTLQHGVVVVPRTSTPSHIAENLEAACASFQLSTDDVGIIDALNEAHPYYWSPLPLLPPGTLPDKTPP